MLLDTPHNRKRAHDLIAAGQLAAARTTLRALLLASPESGDLTGLLATVAFREGQHGEAEALCRKGLSLSTGPRARLRSLHNLGVVLRRLGRGAEMPSLAAAEAPDWPAGQAPDADERRMVRSLAEHLLAAGALAAARRLLDRALPDRSEDAAALLIDGRLALAEGDGAAAAERLAAAARLAPGDPRPLLALGHAHYRNRDAGPAVETARRIAGGWPVCADPPRPSHRGTILVLNQAPASIRSPSVDLRNTHYTQNFATEVAKSMRADYRFVSLFADLPDGVCPDPLPAEVRQADLVLNNMVNAERLNAPGVLDLVSARLAGLGLPVINPPKHAALTTREGNARLLQGIANLKVPRLLRCRTDGRALGEVAAEIDASFDYPLILRKSTAHQSAQSLLGKGPKSAVLVADAAALRLELERAGWRDFYAMEFVDLKRPDGFYRKIRAVVVDREVIVTKPSIYSEWMVAGWRSKPEGIAFFRANPHTVEECNRIALDPEAHLGAAAMRTLEAVRDRIPLDVFGIDFDVDRAGRVVFFEASAAMTFQPDPAKEPEDVRLPDAPFRRLDAAFRDLFARQIAEWRRVPA